MKPNSVTGSLYCTSMLSQVYTSSFLPVTYSLRPCFLLPLDPMSLGFLSVSLLFKSPSPVTTITVYFFFFFLLLSLALFLYCLNKKEKDEKEEGKRNRKRVEKLREDKIKEEKYLTQSVHLTYIFE